MTLTTKQIDTILYSLYNREKQIEEWLKNDVLDTFDPEWKSKLTVELESIPSIRQVMQEMWIKSFVSTVKVGE